MGCWVVASSCGWEQKRGPQVLSHFFQHSVFLFLWKLTTSCLPIKQFSSATIDSLSSATPFACFFGVPCKKEVGTPPCSQSFIHYKVDGVARWTYYHLSCSSCPLHQHTCDVGALGRIHPISGRPYTSATSLCYS